MVYIHPSHSPGMCFIPVSTSSTPRCRGSSRSLIVRCTGRAAALLSRALWSLGLLRLLCIRFPHPSLHRPVVHQLTWFTLRDLAKARWGYSPSHRKSSDPKYSFISNSNLYCSNSKLRRSPHGSRYSLCCSSSNYLRSNNLYCSSNNHFHSSNPSCCGNNLCGKGR